MIHIIMSPHANPRKVTWWRKLKLFWQFFVLFPFLKLFLAISPPFYFFKNCFGKFSSFFHFLKLFWQFLRLFHFLKLFWQIFVLFHFLPRLSFELCQPTDCFVRVATLQNISTNISSCIGIYLKGAKHANISFWYFFIFF